MKKLKMIFVFFLIFAIFISIVNYVNAEEVISAMGGLKGGGTSSATGKLSPIINSVIGFIQITGTGISVIMVSVLGIKYLLASPGDKADVKKQIAPMVIGAILLFASVNIIQIIADFADTLPE